MGITILSFAVLISAIIAIVFIQRGDTNLYAVFKALTTALIISIAFFIYDTSSSDYSAIMIVALLFSLIGDVFLVKKEYFLYGLSAFLIAHVCFILGFISFHGFDWSIIPLIPLVIIAGIYYNYLGKDLAKYSIPVLVYITVIVVMNWQAINLAISIGDSMFLVIAIASILFSLSDAILAYNKFKKPFRFAGVWILSTYWTSIFVFTIAGLYIGD